MTRPTPTTNATFTDTTTVDEMIRQAEAKAAAGTPADPSVLNDVRTWFGTYLRTVTEADLDLLALWAAHTWLVNELYTTPRLLIDSPVPGSGKTTCLEHLQHLAQRPVQMASLSSPAMIARMLENEMRTILIDEADRSLRPDAQGTPDLLAVLNSGYKRGATRPVLVPDKEQGWKTAEMPTYSPVAMAGNSPNLPEDTRSRTIRVLLLPDLDGSARESDWELIEDDAEQMAVRLAAWAEQVRPLVASIRPPMPTGITGRFREKWQPLARVAVAAGGDWQARVDAMAVADKEQVAADREDGMITTRPHIVLLQHLAEVWPDGDSFAPTVELVDALAYRFPDVWGESSSYGSALTTHRFGRMLATNYKVNSKFRTPRHVGPRGYRLRDLADVMGRMGITPPSEPSQVSQPSQASRPDSASGTDRTDGTDGTLPGTPPTKSSQACRLHGTDHRADVCHTCEQITGGTAA